MDDYLVQLQSILSRPHLHSRAKLLGFCKRESKLSPELFFELLLYCSLRKEEVSLSQMVVYLADRYGVCLRKQSLDARFSDKCVSFIVSVLKEILEEKLSALYPLGLLDAFARVRIKDSTKFKVPSNLSKEFNSCGNSKRFKAGVSIQYEYDIKSGKILDLSIHPSNRNDRTDAVETSDSVESNDLIIRDLGYFGVPVFKQFIEKKACFVSRLDSTVNVFDEKQENISFEKLYRQMKKYGLSQIEIPVLVGEHNKLPLRMIVSLVTEDVYEMRLKKRSKNNQSRGYAMNQETRLRYRFNLFITNASEEQIPMEKVYIIYKLRWQIELIFKYWKSIFAITKTGSKMKKNRLLCMLYIKLLMIIINFQFVYMLQRTAYKDLQKRREKENVIEIPVLSLCKSLKTLFYFFEKLLDSIMTGKEETRKIAGKIQEILSQNHYIEKRKNRVGFVEILELFICKTEK